MGYVKLLIVALLALVALQSVAADSVYNFYYHSGPCGPYTCYYGYGPWQDWPAPTHHWYGDGYNQGWYYRPYYYNYWPNRYRVYPGWW